MSDEKRPAISTKQKALREQYWPQFLAEQEAKRTKEASESQDFKVRENKARRAAQRQGLQLVKSRLRDPRAIGYGTYMIVDPFDNAVLAGERMTIEDVEWYLYK